MKKTFVIEFSCYLLLFVLVTLTIHKIPFAQTAMLILSFFMAIGYFFIFTHWFKSENIIALRIVGSLIFSYVPVTLAFITMDLPGKEITFILQIVAFISYWIIRKVRKTWGPMTAVEEIGLYVIFLMTPMLFIATT